jgi:hypothetical protein
MLMRAHKHALATTRGFWKLVLQSDVRFDALVEAFGLIEQARGRAEKTYETVLERYPQNVRLLRSYAR